MAGRWGQGDLLAGLVAAAAFLLLAFALDFHLVVAILLSVAIYAGLVLLRPRRQPLPPETSALPTTNGAASRPAEPAGRNVVVNPQAVARFGLTARQIEILPLIAQRLTDREIGERLCISHRTVMNHASEIFGKLGVSNRRELRDFIAKHHLLLPPPASDEHE